MISTCSDNGLPMPRQRYAIIAMSFGTALVVTDNGIASVALPTIAHSLAVTRADTVMVVTIYQMVLLMAILPFSSLGDRIGLKRMYQTGQAVFLLSTILTALATNLPMLLAARACQAVGVAGALSVGTALLRRVYPANRLARGLGLNGIIIASAGALAPSLGGFLLALGSWRLVFAAAVPFAILSLMLGRALPVSPPTRADIDGVGSILSAMTFGLVLAALQLIAHHNAIALAAPLMVSGLTLAVVFVRRERGRHSPILPVDLFAKSAFSVSIAAALAAFCGSMLFTLYLPFLLQSSLGFGPATTGSIMAAWPLTMMASASLAGFFLAKTRSGVLGSLGMACTATGLLLIAIQPEHPSILRIVIPMMLGGAGFGLFLAPNTHQIMSAAPPVRSASAGAMVSTTRLVGSSIGATSLSLLLGDGHAVSHKPIFIAAGIIFLAAICSFLHTGMRPFTRRRRVEADSTDPNTAIV